ncbi:MAG TPA: hypothetical protein V6C76_06140 [Drouetiella sp.]
MNAHFGCRENELVPSREFVSPAQQSLSERFWNDINIAADIVSPPCGMALFGARTVDQAASKIIQEFERREEPNPAPLPFRYEHRPGAEPFPFQYEHRPSSEFLPYQYEPRHSSVPLPYPYEHASHSVPLSDPYQRYPGAAPLESRPNAVQESQKIENLYKETLTTDERMRAEALEALKTEGKFVSRDPELKNTVATILEHELGKSLVVERDAQGNPQALRFHSLKEFEDEARFNAAKKRHDHDAMKAARGELIKDAIAGEEYVSLLSPGQTPLYLDR